MNPLVLELAAAAAAFGINTCFAQAPVGPRFRELSGFPGCPRRRAAAEPIGRSEQPAAGGRASLAVNAGVPVAVPAGWRPPPHGMIMS